MYSSIRMRIKQWNGQHSYRINSYGWALTNWCFCTVVLEKILESPLDSKEIKSVNPKRNQPWIFIGYDHMWCHWSLWEGRSEGLGHGARVQVSRVKEPNCARSQGRPLSRALGPQDIQMVTTFNPGRPWWQHEHKVAETLETWYKGKGLRGWRGGS